MSTERKEPANNRFMGDDKNFTLGNRAQRQAPTTVTPMVNVAQTSRASKVASKALAALMIE